METKYRYRNSDRKCPECEASGTIIKGRAEYGGGWLCFAKKGGCGAKWADGTAEIESQQPGKEEHADPADYYNTVLKMGKKRAHVDAVLTATACSDIFTQDIEDMDLGKVATKAPAGKQPAKQPSRKSSPQPAGSTDKPMNATQVAKVMFLGQQLDSPLSSDEVQKVIDWYCGVNGGNTYANGEYLKASLADAVDGYLDSLQGAEAASG